MKIVSASGCEIDNENLEDLVAGNLDCEELDISETPLSDILCLEKLKKLRVLDLHDTKVTSIDALSGLALTLTSLNIADTSISPDNFRALSQFKQLRSLNLKRAVGRSGSLEFLVPLGELRELDLTGAESKDLGSLHKLTHLRELSLSETAVTDLKFLSGCQQLEVLDLSATKVSDLSPLVRLPRLRKLYLLDTSLEPQVLLQLKEAPCLTEIIVDNDVSMRAVKQQVLQYIQEKPLANTKENQGETKKEAKLMIKEEHGQNAVGLGKAEAKTTGNVHSKDALVIDDILSHNLSGSKNIADRVEEAKRLLNDPEKSAIGQYTLATCFRYGWGLKENSANSIELYISAATQHHAGACYELGRMYLQGNSVMGINEDYKQAVYYAELGTKEGRSITKFDTPSYKQDHFVELSEQLLTVSELQLFKDMNWAHFQQAVYFGRVEEVKAMLNSNTNLIKEKDRLGNNALILAAMYGREQIFNWLLSEEAALLQLDKTQLLLTKPNVNNEGMTPFLAAIYGRQPELTGNLLQKYSHLDLLTQTDRHNRNALAIAKFYYNDGSDKSYQNTYEFIQLATYHKKLPSLFFEKIKKTITEAIPNFSNDAATIISSYMEDDNLFLFFKKYKNLKGNNILSIIETSKTDVIANDIANSRL